MPSTSPAGAAALDHLGVLRVQGADAVTFLQGQLTSDVALLPDDQARLAAWCSAKGRMLASFVLWKPDAGTVLLVGSRDLLEATQKRLAMFVLRAKAVVSDATADYVLHGLLGTPAAEPWTLQREGDAVAVALYPADGTHRALHCAPAGTPAPALAADAAAWRWSEIAGGVATISAPVADAFVPQMLNYESVGGVSFKKGCYPGQEVVARSQFRGTLKRRGYRIRGAAPMAAGQEVWPAGGGEPCGTVVQAAAAPGGGWEALASLQVAAAAGPLHLGAADGPALALGTLPYALLADV